MRREKDELYEQPTCGIHEIKPEPFRTEDEGDRPDHAPLHGGAGDGGGAG